MLADIDKTQMNGRISQNNNVADGKKSRISIHLYVAHNNSHGKDRHHFCSLFFTLSSHQRSAASVTVALAHKWDPPIDYISHIVHTFHIRLHRKKRQINIAHISAPLFWEYMRERQRLRNIVALVWWVWRSCLHRKTLPPTTYLNISMVGGEHPCAHCYFFIVMFFSPLICSSSDFCINKCALHHRSSVVRSHRANNGHLFPFSIKIKEKTN